jgi:hypothetical protein
MLAMPRVLDAIGQGSGGSFGVGKSAALKAGEMQLGTLGGGKAANFNMDARLLAEDMAKAGADRQKILDETGFFKDADGHWKHEITNHRDRLTSTGETDLNLGMSRKLGDVYSAPDLYAAYPQLKDLEVHNRVPDKAGGVFDPRTWSIGIRPGQKRRDIEDIITHELEHGVQHIEGWAPGSSPAEFKLSGPERTMHTRAMEDTGAARRALMTAEARGVPLETAAKSLEKMGMPVSEEALMRARMTPRDKLDVENKRHRQIVEYSADEGAEGYRRLLPEANARTASYRRTMSPGERKDIPWWTHRAQDVPDDQLNLRKKQLELYIPDAIKGMFRQLGGLGGLGGR